jgi:glycosyltransferase involved in cell wall biosynthesis
LRVDVHVSLFPRPAADIWRGALEPFRTILSDSETGDLQSDADRADAAGRLKVTQISVGRFHHFHLARQLERFGLLDRLWTGYPRFKLKDELGIPPSKISSFPWLQSLNMGWPRLPIIGKSNRAQRELNWLAHDTLDRRAAVSLREAGILIALSGQGERSGRRMQTLGGWHICDRGSSHIRYQDAILREEYARWKLDYLAIDPRIVAKEEAEYESSDLITVPSGFAEQSFLEMGVPAGKMHRIPYGGRLERFRPEGNPPKGSFNVLFVGHVSLRKGVPYLLEAFSRLKHPHKRLQIAGSVDPVLAPILAKLPSDHVEYLGTVANVQLSKLYCEAHVMVLPSVEEGLAMVMGEAMACGCPVVASGNTGAQDIFTDGQEGFIVPIRSSESILRALQQLADDPCLATNLRRRCVERMHAVDGWDGYGRRWRELIESLPMKRINAAMNGHAPETI